MLSEISQRQILRDITYTWNLKKCNKLVVTGGERERGAIQGQSNQKVRGTNYQVKK